jgi:probable phosphoglycerate mutase
MNADIYIVRHGNTFDPGDTLLRVGARTDLALSVSGCEQADRLGRHFRERDIVFSSIRTGPLRRTRETTDRIGAYQRSLADIRIEPFLKEIDYGPDEGVAESEVLARIGPAGLQAWEEAGRPPPGWIVDPPALEASWRSLFEHLQSSPGAHLVVTSNGIARFARSAIGDSGPGKLSTGGYGVIRLSAGGPEALCWNERP